MSSIEEGRTPYSQPESTPVVGEHGLSTDSTHHANLSTGEYRTGRPIKNEIQDLNENQQPPKCHNLQETPVFSSCAQKGHAKDHDIPMHSNQTQTRERVEQAPEPRHKPQSPRHKKKTRRSGPSLQESESRISAQQHRRNGKSIQCPFNVTTYLGHTLFVGSALQLFLYFVIMLTIGAIANRNARMFRIYPNCFFSIARITENAPSCANQTACLFDCVRFSHKTACRHPFFHNFPKTNIRM